MTDNQAEKQLYAFTFRFQRQWEDEPEVQTILIEDSSRERAARKANARIVAKADDRKAPSVFVYTPCRSNVLGKVKRSVVDIDQLRPSSESAWKPWRVAEMW